LYYPAHIPEQIGWIMIVPALVGFVAALRAERRSSSWPYLAMMAATYLTFTPMAELEARHAIYWVPALAVFAADGCRLIADWGARIADWKTRGRLLRWSLYGVVIVGTVWIAWQDQGLYVRGCEEAARYVVENNE